MENIHKCTTRIPPPPPIHRVALPSPIQQFHYCCRRAVPDGTSSEPEVLGAACIDKTKLHEITTMLQWKRAQRAQSSGKQSQRTNSNEGHLEKGVSFRPEDQRTVGENEVHGVEIQQVHQHRFERCTYSIESGR